MGGKKEVREASEQLAYSRARFDAAVTGLRAELANERDETALRLEVGRLQGEVDHLLGILRPLLRDPWRVGGVDGRGDTWTECLFCEQERDLCEEHKPDCPTQDAELMGLLGRVPEKVGP